MSSFHKSRFIISPLFCGLICSLFVVLTSCEAPENQLGLYELVEIDFKGPSASEDDSVNPFTNYRMEVTFKHEKGSFTVPGFYAADGNASETSASSGDVWRVRYAPSFIGDWTYQARLYQGDNAYLKLLSDLEEYPLENSTGQFSIVEKAHDASIDLTHKGPLKYDGTRYLKWSANNQPYIKAGANSPENFLAYQDFDNTYGYDTTKQFIKSWEPHLKDWKAGDPTWQDGKGKGIIGSLNYLSEKGMNSLYFLTMNIEGDGRDVWPYISHEDFTRFDVSKLAQWDIVFRHAQRMGIAIQFVIQETENETLLDEGDTGPIRQLYFRELLARFGYHKGLSWNLGEENGPVVWEPIGQSDQQRKDMCEWFYNNDPYDHPVMLHTHSSISERDTIIEPLLGYKRLDGLSVQIDQTAQVHDQFVRNYKRSKAAGQTWVQHMDEIGKYWKGAVPDADEPAHDTMRIDVLWGSLMGGGAGVEWYFGYKYAQADLNCEDWRSRDILWDQSKVALDIFEKLPVEEMEPYDELVKSGSWCLAQPGETYLVYYYDESDEISLDLTSVNGTYNIEWYHPRTSSKALKGSLADISGGSMQSLGSPPEVPSGPAGVNDWAIVITKN